MPQGIGSSNLPLSDLLGTIENMLDLLKKPSAWVPILLSICIIGMEVVVLTFFATPQPEPDEGVAAHLFQLWLVLEAVLIPVFALKWLARFPIPALQIIALQALLVLVGCFPVFYLNL